MSFPQMPSFLNNAQSQESAGSNAGNPAGGIDSISLGQLKQLVASMPKDKQWWYDYKYDDEDTVMNEIEEFYSYVEMPQVAENLKAWEGSFSGRWTGSSPAKRKAHIEVLLESLEHRNAEIRFTNARRLFYIVQGTFAETVSPEHQLHWIFENCKIVRSANGLSTIIEAMKIASSKHDLLCGLSDAEAAHFHISASEKADFIEEVTTEISVYLGMLYHLVEIFKTHDDFADELMSFDPPLPVYLFTVVSGLRDKSARGYPVKKLLLVLWKTLLSCCGGIRDHARVKKLARELAGLQTAVDGGEATIKATPLDIETFRQETSVKYPTFTPPAPPPEAPPLLEIAAPKPIPITTSRLAQAYSPIPIRHHYHHDQVDSSVDPHQLHHGGGGPQPQPFHPGARGVPQPATPAPTPPPPSPKPKKQQYQTDQTRPFLFPFSRNRYFDKDARLVPFAVDEADRLYNRHMYVSLALSQMWRTREDCMTAESGLEHMPGSEGQFESSTFIPKDQEAAEPLPDIALLDAKIAEATKAMEETENPSEKRKAKERREDLMRLKRVEQIYSAVLPVLSGWVLVLLKLLLATVSASTNMQPPQSSTSNVFPPGVASPQDQPSPQPPTSDEIDVTRHREITSKAVSAILLLVLKWFKVSHIMKFHHLGQHLLDTNCLLLILKMFSLQDLAAIVVSKADSPDNNFFRYCMLKLSKNPQPMGPAEGQLRPPRHTVVKTRILPNGEKHEEEVDMVTEFSWRNFFATINFAKIMQKLSKNRSHRIWMLIQYKSSPVLKRALKVQHPMFQLHILKLIKSQVPFCGRKWRQTNMKVITSIYLNCRPDLRDEWLTSTEVDDASDAQAQEHALRHLVKFYNNRRYGPIASMNQHGQSMHRHGRSGSMSYLEGLHPGPELGLIRPVTGTPNMVDADVFPPSRSQAPDPSIFLPYITEDIAFEEEYEEYLSDLGWSDSQGTGEDKPLFGGTSAWSRLPAFAADIADGISDSESIASIGELGDDARLDPSRDDPEVVDENLNNWEHMSPKTMAALPKSPAGGRRSSSGGGLRPVLPFGLDDAVAVDLDDEEEEIELGPAPREQTGFTSGAGVDEVEYAYGV
ncbi:Striatin-interacting protein 1 [Mycena venus]|uniref:Striatin-interacting protein 1 n=1 Tax=Mycena venus TaxID=2733690 RepID=A0A8H6Y721_9AGAR|nr:Striatin-interacting protein 1 [Mycena venus]